MSKAEPKNILALEMPINGEGEFGRLNIEVVGAGRMLLFRSGKVYEGQWRKEGPDVPFIFEDHKGNPLALSRGQGWMIVLPTLERVSWGEG